jgi:excisionase family DNA binding protein
MDPKLEEMPGGDAAGGNRRARRVEAHRRRRGDLPPTDAIAFRIDDACRLSGLGRTTLYGLVRAGRLRLLRVGGRSLIDGDSLRSLLRGGA